MNTLTCLLLIAVLAVNVWSNPLLSTEPTSDEDTSVIEAQEIGDDSDQLGKRHDAKVLPNIGYLFQAYNLIKGNPLDPRGFDPGFSSLKIFEATYDDERKTSDGRYKIPDKIDAIASTTCSVSATSETMSTESQYKDSLNVKAEASVSGGTAIWQASFSASTEYNRVSETLKSNSKSVIKSEATCSTYEAAVHSNPAPKFTENFFNNVAHLAKNKDYYTFLDRFGTHYVEKIRMGSRYSKMQTITKEKMEKLQSEGIDVSVTASASLIGTVDVSTSTSVSKSKEEMEKFEKSLEEIKEVTFGSKPPSDGTTATWIQQSTDSPYPVYYSLRSILELFRAEYFRDKPDVPFNEIKQGLQEFLQGYCAQFRKKHHNVNAECEGPKKGCGGGSICSANADCIDGQTGSHGQDYKCQCKAGFKGDGVRCEKLRVWTPTKSITQKLKGGWGTWGGMQYCPNGVFAEGFILKAEPYIDGDDTAANGVCLICNGRTDVCSKIGPWGYWSEEYKCPAGSYLSGWRQNVESYQGRGDDTALDNVEYRCRDFSTWELQKNTLKGNGPQWGSWSRYVECPDNEFICGIKTRVEDPDGDDTALNDIEHKCCKPKLTRRKRTSQHGQENLSQEEQYYK